MEDQIKKCIKPITVGSTKKVYLIGDDILTSSRYTDDSINEISMLTSLSHPNIIKIKDVMKKGSNTVWIRQNYRGESVRRCQSLGEEGIMTVLVQMLKVLVYLEANNIIHRDIKTENIVVEYDTDGIVATLLDFSLATNVLSDTLSTNVYNEDVNEDIYYRPPEVNKDKGYDFKADIWALGSSILEIIAGDKADKLMKRIHNNDRDKTISKVIDSLRIKNDKLVSILYSMLSYNPEDRPSASDCLSYLEVTYDPVISDKELFILTLGNDEDVYQWFIDVISDLNLTCLHLYLAYVNYRRLKQKKCTDDGIGRGCIILSLCLIDYEVNLGDVFVYFDLYSEDAYALAQLVLERLDYKAHISISRYKQKFYIRLFKDLENGGQHIVELL